MAYYGSGYRSWRSRDWNSSGPSKYAVLADLFGSAVGQIRNAFENLDDEALDELFFDYGVIHGESAEKYARKTYPKWKSGVTKLSGQTMERLVELVPPYLSPQQRFSLLQSVLNLHKKSGSWHTVRINVMEPAQGFAELSDVLSQMKHEDVLAHLPAHVMKAANWLYDDDITAARSMLADAERLENDMIRAKAVREIELLKRTISSGQVRSADYSVEMPAGTLSVCAYTPSKCFIATTCFGEAAPETAIFRQWRDEYLIERAWGRRFVVWYYQNGENLAALVNRSSILHHCVRGFLKVVAFSLSKTYSSWVQK